MGGRGGGGVEGEGREKFTLLLALGCMCVGVWSSLYLLFAQELTLVTKPGEGFGFAICGGLNGYPGNPLDETDEGIFISQVSGIVGWVGGGGGGGKRGALRHRAAYKEDAKGRSYLRGGASLLPTPPSISDNSRRSSCK